NSHRLAVEKLHFDFQIGNQVVHRIAQNVFGQVGLFVIRGVHEVVIVTVGIKELHVDLVHIDLFDGIGRAEAVFEHSAGTKIAQLGLDEGAQVARRPVFDGEYGVQI